MCPSFSMLIYESFASYMVRNCQIWIRDNRKGKGGKGEMGNGKMEKGGNKKREK
jgi:hypothetical protein